MFMVISNKICPEEQPLETCGNLLALLPHKPPVSQLVESDVKSFLIMMPQHVSDCSLWRKTGLDDRLREEPMPASSLMRLTDKSGLVCILNNDVWIFKFVDSTLVESFIHLSPLI